MSTTNTTPEPHRPRLSRRRRQRRILALAIAGAIASATAAVAPKLISWSEEANDRASNAIASSQAQFGTHRATAGDWAAQRSGVSEEQRKFLAQAGSAVYGSGHDMTAPSTRTISEDPREHELDTPSDDLRLAGGEIESPAVELVGADTASQVAQERAEPSLTARPVDPRYPGAILLLRDPKPAGQKLTPVPTEVADSGDNSARFPSSFDPPIVLANRTPSSNTDSSQGEPDGLAATPPPDVDAPIVPDVLAPAPANEPTVVNSADPIADLLGNNPVNEPLDTGASAPPNQSTGPQSSPIVATPYEADWPGTSGPQPATEAQPPEEYAAPITELVDNGPLDAGWPPAPTSALDDSGDGHPSSPLADAEGPIILEEIYGTTPIQGPVIALGPISPGHSPGDQPILGDLDLLGTLIIEIQGTDPILYDRLLVDGHFSADDALIEFAFIEGFVPQAGDIFSFLFADSGLDALFDNGELDPDQLRFLATGLPSDLIMELVLVEGDFTVIPNGAQGPGSPMSFNQRLDLVISEARGQPVSLAQATGQIPEPSPFALLVLGGTLVLLSRKRQRGNG